jgi:asparagine synthase (glutamine-hydrolysing)
VTARLYDFKELKEEALPAIFRFLSGVPAIPKVLFHAWIHWGVKGTRNRIQGTFAFAFYDQQTRDVVIARDKIGIKPLFYFEINGYLYFASELKSAYLGSSRPEVEQTQVNAGGNRTRNLQKVYRFRRNKTTGAWTLPAFYSR